MTSESSQRLATVSFGRAGGRLLNVLGHGGLISFASVVSFILLWELGGAVGWLKPYQFPAPSRIISAFIELSESGFPADKFIWTHVGTTLWRILQGYVFSLVVAIPLGIAIGSSDTLDKLFAPIIVFGRSVATLSLLPLVIVWFGTGELTKVILIAYGCFWVMISNVVAAVRYVDPVLINAARMMDTPLLSIFLRVVMPSALPRIFAGARISLGLGFMVIVGAEMIGTIEGLGALIMEARTFYRSDITIVGMLLIGMLGFAISYLLGSLEKILMPWHVGLEEVRR